MNSVEHYTARFKAIHKTIRWKTAVTNFPLNIYHTSALKPELHGKKTSYQEPKSNYPYTYMHTHSVKNLHLERKDRVEWKSSEIQINYLACHFLTSECSIKVIKVKTV